MLLKYHRLCLLFLLTGTIIISCAPTPSASRLTHPCHQTTSNQEPLLLLNQASEQLQAYLETIQLTATLQVKEEGALMLGAYPRAKVLWAIRVTEPAISADDQPLLEDIALAAYCLRSGWVWLNIRPPSQKRILISYTLSDLEELYHKKGYQ